MMNTNASELCVLSSLAGLHPKLTDETSATAVCCSQSCLTRRPCHQNMPVDEEPGQLRRVATPRLVCYQVLSHWLLPWHTVERRRSRTSCCLWLILQRLWSIQPAVASGVQEITGAIAGVHRKKSVLIIALFLMLSPSLFSSLSYQWSHTSLNITFNNPGKDQCSCINNRNNPMQVNTLLRAWTTLVGHGEDV